MQHDHTPHDRGTESKRPREDAYRRETPDVSSGWREEYAAQAVETDIRADGGTVTALPAPGDRVRDRETDDELVVVAASPETRADEHAIEALEGATVADVNDDYDPSAPVVDAVYLTELDEALDGWRSIEDVRDAVSFGAVNAYSFPAPRLAATGGCS